MHFRSGCDRAFFERFEIVVEVCERVVFDDARRLAQVFEFRQTGFGAGAVGGKARW